MMRNYRQRRLNFPKIILFKVRLTFNRFMSYYFPDLVSFFNHIKKYTEYI